MSDLFSAPIRELGEFDNIKKDLFKKSGIVELEGCVDSQKAHLIHSLVEEMDHGEDNILVITYDEARARELLENLRFYEPSAGYFPARDLIFYQADIKGNLLIRERLSALKGQLRGEKSVVVTTVDAVMERMSPPDTIMNNLLSLREGDVIAEDAFSAVMVKIGYERVARVDAPGQFAVRGGILDVFSLTEENPFRIELWGEEIDSIRSFDCESQRSIERITEITIYPASETVLSKEEMLKGMLLIEEDGEKLIGELKKKGQEAEANRLKQLLAELREQLTFGNRSQLEGFLPYFYKGAYCLLDLFEKKNTVIFMDEPVRIYDKAEAIMNEFKDSILHRAEKGYALKGQLNLLFDIETVIGRMTGYACSSLCTISQKKKGYSPSQKYHITARNVNSYNNSFEALIDDLKKYKKSDSRVLLLCPSRTRGKRLAEDILYEGFNAFFTEERDRELKKGEVLVTYGHVTKGFEYPLLNMVVISESDIFGAKHKKKRKKATYEGQKISSFTELSVGDYVVHENHGLGIYQGIEHIEVDKITKDYMKITYRDGGNLYVPVSGMDVVQKYASADSKAPKLNKLGGQEWKKTTDRVKGAVSLIAKDLVELYAKRQKKDGFVFGEDTVWQREFEEMFPFEETEDQLNAIEDTKRDMQSTKIMDRLICGDVGYGKTEVAIRAAFKAVQEGKQVALLAPTTILAQQHYNNFVQRMKDFPVNIDLLCRFKSKKEQKDSVERLKKGLVDIIIGTHRLISKDVEFKDLGLLIVDEEQRFGVSHKEKIKKIRENVDVLTLSATPIPRTLHMSLVGIRDMSVLEEPPQDRMPIQTFVMEYNEEMVREAITRELTRGGQVYYVYNRVDSIADMAARIEQLVPDAVVEYAHGKMNERELEEKMVDFINGDTDVLVSTTIIETGLDIPNVNTIIVHDSDRMGLSQLYQLRGRVGRSNRTAYAFLMYRKDKILKEEAEKRLAAIREFTELGSGFKIAMRDLEIRGAGSVLGEQQHGHMEAVGYDLYCKLLNQAVLREKGERVEDEFYTTIDMDIDAYIPSKYVSNESMKLDIYKRVASIESEVEAEDIKEELLDRFGKIPECVENLIRISLLREIAHSVFIEELFAKNNRIRLVIYPRAKLDPMGFADLLGQYEGRLSFKAGEKPTLEYYRNGKDNESLEEICIRLLDSMKQLL